METHSDSKQLSPELLQALGRLLVCSGASENAIGLLILRMLSAQGPINLEGYPLVSGMNFNVKLSIIHALAALRLNAADREIIGSLCSELEGAYGDRNDIAHGIIGWDGEDVVLRLTKISRKGAMRGARPLNPSVVDAIADRFLDNSRRLDAILTKIGYTELATLSAEVAPR